jgi:hypothetical protein
MEHISFGTSLNFISDLLVVSGVRSLTSSLPSFEYSPDFLSNLPSVFYCFLQFYFFLLSPIVD